MSSLLAIVIELSDLLSFLTAGLIIAVLIILIIVLLRILKLLTKITVIVDDVAPSFKLTMDNSAAISGNVLDITDDVADATGPLLEDVTAGAEAISMSMGALGGVVDDVTDLFGGFLNFVRRGSQKTESLAQAIGVAKTIFNAYSKLKTNKRIKKKFKLRKK